MIKERSVNIETFMEYAKKFPVFDVRTQEEFEQGHIPGAYNLPLFSGEERAVIGTTYKQEGRQEAVLKGLDYVGPKMRKLVEQVKKVTSDKTILLHCWRGGMRSASTAWLLNINGYRTYVLEGGYKSFRRYILQALEVPRKINILSGHTGCGKTEILKHLSQLGEQVIDLEGLAHHKGSAFGGIGEPDQPTQQQWENQLAGQWLATEPGKPVWLEDESKTVGRLVIPEPLWIQMRKAAVFFLNMPLELRIQRLEVDYGKYSQDELKRAIGKLQKRLGGLHTQMALDALEKNDLSSCAELLLKRYYDKSYLHGLSKRPSHQVYTIDTGMLDAASNAEIISIFCGSLDKVKS